MLTYTSAINNSASIVSCDSFSERYTICIHGALGYMTNHWQSRRQGCHTPWSLAGDRETYGHSRSASRNRSCHVVHTVGLYSVLWPHNGRKNAVF